MSADAEAEGVAHDQLPETGVRNRRQYSRSIHRQDPDAEEVLPACNEAGRADEFKECTPASLLPFGRWELCTHEECFGDDLDRGDGIAADGGVPDDQTVWTAQHRQGGTYCVFHTDTDCSRLQSADKIREKERGKLSPRLRQCRECSGDANYGGHPDRSTYNAVKDADPDDILTDGGQSPDILDRPECPSCGTENVLQEKVHAGRFEWACRNDKCRVSLFQSDTDGSGGES
jgi:hypothetical protein